MEDTTPAVIPAKPKGVPQGPLKYNPHRDGRPEPKLEEVLAYQKEQGKCSQDSLQH